MRMKFLMACMLLLCGSLINAQQTLVRGVVKDATSGETIPGVSISYAEGKGTVTDIDGVFSFSLEQGTYTISANYVGMTPQEKSIKVGNAPVIIEFLLEAVQMKEVEIVGDVAIERKTPVAYTDISSQKIKEELGTRDLPMLLNSTPGIYATQSGGGDGDSRVNIRGFNGRYVAVMVDGIPMNDMENGLVYWSNWFGLDVVTQKVQVQRGLGASKLAIPSVGGTINVLSQGIDQKQKITLASEWGNNMNLRETVGYNSGRLRGGWGITSSISVKKNNGWVDNLQSKQAFYFLKIQKEFKNQSLSLSLMGSPQQHFQRNSRKEISYYDTEYAAKQGVDTSGLVDVNYGVRHNQFWGNITRNRPGDSGETELMSSNINYYHKPIINLKHFWTLGERLALSNIGYISFGNGGGTYLLNSVYDKQGQTDFDSIYYSNTHDVGTGFFINHPYDLAYVNDSSQYKSRNFIYSQVNNHFWAGALSTFKFKMNKRFEFSGGFDGRYYHTDRYQIIYDLLGGDYAVPDGSGSDKNDPNNKVKREGDRYGYNIRSFVKQGGIFLLGEYQKNKMTAFINVTGSVNAYNRTDYFALRAVGGGAVSSGWKTFMGGTVKGGLSYNFNANHSVFFNAGYLSRAKLSANVYVGTTIQTYAGLKNEVIIAQELGYKFTKDGYKIAVNFYNTVWNNKPVNQKLNYGTETYYASVPGMNALHQGGELEASVKVSKKLSFDGVLSVGNWRWISDATATVTDVTGTVVVDTVKFYAKGVKVGDAAQFQASLGMRYEPIKRLYISPRITYFDHYYSDFDPESLQGSNANRQSWKIPAYYQLDLNMGYNHPIGENKYMLGLKVNLINLTNVIYISDARNNDFNNGFNAQSAGVYMGMGFRWNVGVNFTF